jgi:hypothetical protein
MSTRIRDMTKSSAGKVCGIPGAHKPEQLKCFAATARIMLYDRNR